MHLLLDSHDVGGALDATPLCRDERPLQLWERHTDALFGLLAFKQIVNVDSLRRATESLEPEAGPHPTVVPFLSSTSVAVVHLCAAATTQVIPL